ncbi:hypothetical protein [Candidatus Spongiihabitans sp.]|uniref:hypothetical protein n=1 Tax=Candidatus Spongiihabitans sp. TaxID=3101308 RepID=UPI003C7BDA5B
MSNSPPTRHCPAHIIIGRAIQWNMSSGVAGLLLSRLRRIMSHATRDRYLTGFPPSARMTVGRAVFPACRRE